MVGEYKLELGTGYRVPVKMVTSFEFFVKGPKWLF